MHDSVGLNHPIGKTDPSCSKTAVRRGWFVVELGEDRLP